jgi:hypothetical protein
MSHLTRYLAALILLTLTLACAPQTERAATPTPAPVQVTESAPEPTTAQSAPPTRTAPPAPTLTPSPSPSLPPLDPTFLVFPSLTPTPTVRVIYPLVRLELPGLMSKQVSPMRVRAYIDSAIIGATRIELIGEDGRLLSRKTLRTYPNQYSVPTYVSEEIEFEIRAAAELARLQVFTEDARGNILGLSAVHVFLLSVGKTENTPPALETDRVMLLEPRLGQEISADEVRVRGEMNPYNEMPVIVELTTLIGQVLISRVILLDPPDGKYHPFEISLPYSVREKTPARLIIRQADARIEGLIYLFSRQIELLPTQ